MTTKTTIILYGATGDLAKRKLIPALYQLIEKKNFADVIIVGAAFEDVTADQMVNAAQPFITNSNQDCWQQLHNKSYYKRIDFNNADDFVALRDFVEQCEKENGFEDCNRLFYLATSSNFFCSITSHMSAVGLTTKDSNLVSFPQSNAPALRSLVRSKVVYEKPFGHDEQSAHEINECIFSTLDESQVYRIDHYLTKEVVSNIAMVRFTNCVFEPLWSHRYIDQVQIIASETVGIENRGSYYDAYGALRDVMQNHMLELLALICMETPEKLTGEFVREQRVKVLEKVRFDDGILGQYEGYRDEKDVKSDSSTDTYASLKLAVDMPRWAGVPFYLKTGKCLDKKETVIHIKFKQVDCLLMRGCPTESNWLTIKIDPDAVFSLTLNVKHPEAMDQVTPVAMEFCHSCIFGLKTPLAYEILLEEVMRGEQSISVRFDEIEYAWKLIDAIVHKQLPVYAYKKGSQGPQEEQEYTQKHGMRWRS